MSTKESLSQQCRRLVGKRVVSIKLRPWGQDNGGGKAYNPIIEFSDGTRMSFITQEAGDEYGVQPFIHPKDTIAKAGGAA